MAINTLREREAALRQPRPVLLPDGEITAGDRRALLGQYPVDVTPPYEEFVRTRSRRHVAFTSERLTA